MDTQDLTDHIPLDQAPRGRTNHHRVRLGQALQPRSNSGRLPLHEHRALGLRKMPFKPLNNFGAHGLIVAHDRQMCFTIEQRRVLRQAYQMTSQHRQGPPLVFAGTMHDSAQRLRHGRLSQWAGRGHWQCDGWRHGWS
jgi:hypothetical protein